MKSLNTRYLVYITIVGAISYLSAKITKFPVFPSAPFLKMDAGEVPLTIFTLVGGVKFGLIALLVKELLSLTVSGSNPFGLLADFLACGSFLTACWLIYKDRTSFRIITFVTMVVIATLTRLLVVVPVNLLVLRLQFGTCPKEVMKMMVWILPFNGIKAIFTALCAYLLLPKLQKSLSKYFAG